MKTYFNYSIIITLLALILMIYSESFLGNFLGESTDWVIALVGIIVSLILCLISSNFAISHDSKNECFWDVTTDVISIIIHILICVFWGFYSEKYIDYLTSREYFTVLVFLFSTAAISFVEFVITLNNCLESMRRNGSVKINS